MFNNMKHIFLVALLLAVATIATAQDCNQKESIEIFNKAQNLDDEDAAPLFEKAALGFKACQNFDNYLIAAYQSGIAYINTNNDNAAQNILEQAIADTHGKTDSTSNVNMLIFHALGEINLNRKDARRAVFYFNKALDILGNDDSEELAVCLFNLGNAYDMMAQTSNAVSAHRRSIAMKERLEIADSSDYYQAFSALADIYQLAGNADSASFFYGQARGFVDVSDYESLSYVKYKDALEAYNNGDFASAEYLFGEAKSICEVAGLKNDVYIGSCLYLGLIYERQDNSKKAIATLYTALASAKEKNETYLNILLAYGRMIDNEEDAIAKLNEVAQSATNSELKTMAQLEIAKKYEQANRLQDALNLYGQISANTGKKPVICAQALYGIGCISLLNNDFSNAISVFNNALATLADNDKELASVINEAMGNAYFRADSMDKAMLYYTQCLNTMQNLYGASSPKTLSSEENMAAIYAHNEEFEKALDIYKRSLAVKESLYGTSDARMFGLYNSCAYVLSSLASYQEAGTLYAKAQQIQQNNHLQKSQLDIYYNNHGLYCKAIGDFKQALSDLSLALESKKELYGENSIKYANTLNNLGTIYIRLGNFNKAEESFDQAENIITSVSGEQSLALAEVLLNKGNLYNRLGQNKMSLDYYNKAINIKTSNGNDEDRELAPIYNNIGTVYQSAEDYRLAQFFFKKALGIYLNGNLMQETAETYNNLGNVMLKIDKTSEAIANYLKATGIYSHIADVNPTLLGNTYNNIATAYIKLGKLDSALVFYNQSLDIYNKVFGGQHPYLALILNSIGDVNMKTSNYSAAIDYYSQALTANHESYNYKSASLPNATGYYDQNIFVMSLLSRASAYTQLYLQDKNRDHLTFALQHFQLCDELIANMRKSAITKTDKLNLGNIATKCFEGAVEICAELLSGELTEKERDQYEQLAFSYTEKSKSNSLLEAMAGQDAMELANIPAKLREKENLLSGNVLYFEKLLAEKPKNSAQIRDSLHAANRVYDSFIKQLENDFPEYHQLKYANKTVGLRELQAQLSEGTQVRMYLLGQNLIYAIAISRNQFAVNTAPMLKNLTDTVKTYRNSMLQSSQKAVVDFARLSCSLYKSLFPDSIGNSISNLVIIPDGALNQIPYESLVADNNQTSIFDYTNFDFVIKRFAVSYAYSATLYYRDITRNKANGTSGWFGLAPIFTKGKYAGITLDSRLKKKETTFNNIEVVENNKLTPLVSSEVEIRDIFNMFAKAGQPAKAHLWGCANKQNFSSDSISQTKYIHLATHGFVNSEKPELSGVQLSVLNGDNQNGVLYSNDVYGMKLKCDLLILSACETGLGKIMKGEGIIGLSRAFLYAGASNLIVSLWKVSDNSTSQMMMEFYRQMLSSDNASLNYAELLRKAKLSLLADKAYSRPYYWAPFIVIGD